MGGGTAQTQSDLASVTAAQLILYYYFHPPKGYIPPEPVESDATTQVLAYSDWVKLKCACCDRKGGVSGLWRCEFTNGTWPMLLCAACAFHGAHAKWTGFFSRKIIRIDLMTTLTYPSRTL